jgi:plastocyanin
MRPFRPPVSLARPAAVLAALVTSACFSEAPPPAAPPGPIAPMTAAVEAGSATNTFTPSAVTIAKGGTVTWTIGTRRHNVVFFANPAAPAGIEAATGVTASRTFPQTGTYPYNCSLHAGMTGIVNVQ